MTLKAAELTQTELAQTLGLSQAAVAKTEQRDDLRLLDAQRLHRSPRRPGPHHHHLQRRKGRPRPRRPPQDHYARQQLMSAVTASRARIGLFSCHPRDLQRLGVMASVGVRTNGMESLARLAPRQTFRPACTGCEHPRHLRGAGFADVHPRQGSAARLGGVRAIVTEPGRLPLATREGAQRLLRSADPRATG